MRPRDDVPGLLALETSVPPHGYPQDVVTDWVRRWLEEGDPARVSRLLSVYRSAGVRRRASAVPIEDVFAASDFETRNERYAQAARQAALTLTKGLLAQAEIAPSGVDLLVSVSCTGFMIPAVDAYVADALRLGPRLARLPITEAGCAGGVVGLARARDFLLAHPDRCAVVLALEYASLTFQRGDRSATNVVSTALFGDGAAGALLVGARHPARARASASLVAAESRFFPGTTHLMGFRLRNAGLQIVLDRELAPFVRREVGGAVDAFLGELGLARSDVGRWILHPGGRRVIEVMQERLGLDGSALAATEAVLAEHGNMSSATVLFVLDRVLRERPSGHAVLGAFGPGFAAELALLALP